MQCRTRAPWWRRGSRAAARLSLPAAPVALHPPPVARPAPRARDAPRGALAMRLAARHLQMGARSPAARAAPSLQRARSQHGGHAARQAPAGLTASQRPPRAEQGAWEAGAEGAGSPRRARTHLGGSPGGRLVREHHAQLSRVRLALAEERHRAEGRWPAALAPVYTKALLGCLNSFL